MCRSSPRVRDQPAKPALTGPPADPALATWENEGGSIITSSGGRNTPVDSGDPSARDVPTSSATDPARDAVTHPNAALPPERADRLTKALARFLKIEAAAGAALLAATCAALILSNSAPWWLTRNKHTT